MSLYRKFERKDLERGQALVLIALAFVGIAAFVGLTESCSAMSAT